MLNCIKNSMCIYTVDYFLCCVLISSGKLNPLCIKFATLVMKHFCGLAALCAYRNENQTSKENSARTVQVCML